MRTSNKLIILAFVVTIVALVMHDSKLKAVYLSKTYLDPLRDFVAQDFTDFNTIDVNAAGVANVKIVQGPFKVMVKGSAKDFIHISREGTRLKIDAAFESGKKLRDPYYGDYRVYISCPTLLALHFDNQYIVDGKPWKDSVADEKWSRKNTLHGFTLDSVAIFADNGTRLELDSNHLNILTAGMGASSGSAPCFSMLKSNKITTAHLDIRHMSSVVFGSQITNMNYAYDPESKLIFTGETSGGRK